MSFLESLERRLLWSASNPFATLNGGLLAVTGTPQADRIKVGPSGDNIVVTLNGTSESFTASDVQEISVNGGTGADRIVVDPSITIPATLVGGRGADTLRAGGGGETLKGSGGSDSIVGGVGSDLLNGGAGSDSIIAANGGSLITGVLSVQGTTNADAISLTAPDGMFAIKVNGVSDSIAGSTVQSVAIDGGAGADVINVDPAITVPESLFGGRGADTIIAGSGPATLRGDNGNDSIVAGNFGDSLVGGAGDNVLRGGIGDDTLYAINGVADTVIGGGGDDIAHIDMGIDSVAGVTQVFFT